MHGFAKFSNFYNNLQRYLLFYRCVSNCASKINPNARLSITSSCEDNCEKLKYNWTLEDVTKSSQAIKQNIWSNKTLTRKDSASLVVKASTFLEKHQYLFKLEVTNDFGGYII